VIMDAPHAAIMFWGNDHRIASNDISRVVLDTDDAAPSTPQGLDGSRTSSKTTLFMTSATRICSKKA